MNSSRDTSSQAIRALPLFSQLTDLPPQSWCGPDGRFELSRQFFRSYQNGSTATWIERDGNGTPLGFFDGSNDYAYATDGLGSIVAVVSPSGTQAASYTYSPYGETTPDTGGEAAINLLRYTGAFTDPSTNLTKLGHRYNNPHQGR